MTAHSETCYLVLRCARLPHPDVSCCVTNPHDVTSAVTSSEDGTVKMWSNTMTNQDL